MRRTPLFKEHERLGARFTVFHGWELPLDYGSALKEALAVREKAGLFDVSHMGRLLVRAKPEKLEPLFTAPVKRTPVGRVRYGFFLNETGGILEDATLYRLDEELFLFCTNAANRERVKALLSNFEVKDLTAETLQLALQGPESTRLLEPFFPVTGLKYYSFKRFGRVIISRTGYTGERVGYELFLPVEQGVELFRKLAGSAQPCGLAARDVLRVEAGLPLYGNELNERVTPLEVRLERFLKEEPFVGKEALKKRPVKVVLTGFEASGGVPRKGYAVYADGRKVGVVTSGVYSPYLKKAVGFALVKPGLSEGTPVVFKQKEREIKGTLARYPFIRRE
ncbi:MAG: glycine cleavage system aminomethyltransferase GcvT [Aquificae bacterium]|nr:glycine cleavage system aminomethyltransferase GcvT [Aquificota bacterium]